VQIIGVIDVLGGRAVHARGGCRQAYRPIDVVSGTLVNGDPAALARLYEQLEIVECYVADLDAIAGGNENDEAIRRVVSPGLAVWLDAGVSTIAQALRARNRGASRVIVGLETLASFAALGTIASVIGPEAIAFSLDLRDGTPICADPALAELPIDGLAARAADAGAPAIIVLDLARIGSGRGVDLSLIERVRRAAPGVALFAGGGVRDAGDLQRLARAGCDGALVATVLHAAGAAELVRAGRNAIPHG
jgi:phosphoribosylformimino-5-aminoimidazole carboxamide ribotide isomerase